MPLSASDLAKVRGEGKGAATGGDLGDDLGRADGVDAAGELVTYLSAEGLGPEQIRTRATFEFPALQGNSYFAVDIDESRLSAKAAAREDAELVAELETAARAERVSLLRLWPIYDEAFDAAYDRAFLESFFHAFETAFESELGHALEMAKDAG